MGKIKNGILGGLSGLVGPIVGVVTKDKNWVRSRPKKSSLPRSVAQLAQNQKIILLHPLFKDLNPFLKLSFKLKAIERDLNPYNAAKSANLLTAIAGVYPEQRVNWEGMILADGQRAMPEQVQLRSLKQGFELSWSADFEEAHGSGSDRTMLYAFCQQLKKPLYIIDGARRSELKDVFPLPKSYKGKTFQIFMAFRDARTDDVSRSVYCGAHVF